jgi:hypothetical protein
MNLQLRLTLKNPTDNDLTALVGQAIRAMT